jgi:ElaB/YqjD/DUF883 family membrane-anchored ribosome-binding protein
MVQAQRFAARQNFTDAVARVRLVRDAVEAALGRAANSTDQGRLERHLARAEEQLQSLESQYDAWRSAIAERRQNTIDQAEEEMSRPLPTLVD